MQNYIFLLLTVVCIATVIGAGLLLVNLNLGGAVAVLIGGTLLLMLIGELEKKK